MFNVDWLFSRSVDHRNRCKKFSINYETFSSQIEIPPDLDEEGAFLPTLGPKVRFTLLFLVTTSWPKFILGNSLEKNCHSLLASAFLKSNRNAKIHFNDDYWSLMITNETSTKHKMLLFSYCEQRFNSSNDCTSYRAGTLQSPNLRKIASMEMNCLVLDFSMKASTICNY